MKYIRYIKYISIYALHLLLFLPHPGYYATRALRIEKFYAFWGQDLDTFTTPLECGRSWRVKFNVSKVAGKGQP